MTRLLSLLSGYLCMAVACSPAKTSQQVSLADKGKAAITIVLPDRSTETQQFAAAELSRYLQQISGASFTVSQDKEGKGQHILLEHDEQLPTEDYNISIRDQDIHLSGGSDRAVLYAVYDFLHGLGCQWLAPGYSFYNGQAEYIPHQPTISYVASGDVQEHPRFAYRKLDVEEGRSHDTENLQKMIEWMPKLRYNTLMVPLNYGGWGKVQWENWRAELTPELKKRGLLVEVGGHGYQNFLNAGMPADSSGKKGHTLFEQHPDWFGKAKDCKPSEAEYIVFNTNKEDAMQYFLHNVLQYLRAHPEIDIFDCWPPDGARWHECASDPVTGSPQDLQASVVNRVDSAIKTLRPDLRLEIIAYADALQPPANVALNKDIMVDFCPINQEFEKQIFDTTSRNNTDYVTALRAWREKSNGVIGLYSYYRKYAWRSLPLVIPHYMQQDMQWYAQVPLQGITTYAEPGDWYTYELNHYILGQLAWNPGCAVDSLIHVFCRTRYQKAQDVAIGAFSTLEQVMRATSSIPYITPKSQDTVDAALHAVQQQLATVEMAMRDTSNKIVLPQLTRLQYMLQYAVYDLHLQSLIASGASPGTILATTKELVAFLMQHKDEGVFLLSGEKDLPRYTRHYKARQQAE